MTKPLGLGLVLGALGLIGVGVESSGVNPLKSGVEAFSLLFWWGSSESGVKPVKSCVGEIWAAFSGVSAGWEAMSAADETED